MVSKRMGERESWPLGTASTDQICDENGEFPDNATYGT
jgi:hypothetical protein